MQLNRRALHAKDPKLVPSRRRKEKSEFKHHWGLGLFIHLCPLHLNVPRWKAHLGTIMLGTLLLQKSVVSGKDTRWKDRYFIKIFLLSILHINPSSPSPPLFSLTCLPHFPAPILHLGVHNVWHTNLRQNQAPSPISRLSKVFHP